MQIVPYMPIHPAQLNSDNVTGDEEVAEGASPILSDDITNDNDDHLFKMPSAPTPYTVEEPCDGNIKRAAPMKRYEENSD